jgi:mono/diheme cytochrome c family protein
MSMTNTTRFLHRSAILWLAACVVLLPTTVVAQRAAPAATPGVPKTDQQKSGEALFQQNCTLCHVPSNDKRRYGIQSSTQLIGLFERPTITDDAVRQFILAGLPGLMPSFQYTLVASELDDLIAYLRIR